MFYLINKEVSIIKFLKFNKDYYNYKVVKVSDSFSPDEVKINSYIYCDKTHTFPLYLSWMCNPGFNVDVINIKSPDIYKAVIDYKLNKRKKKYEKILF